jgi:hypothetical protein
MVTKFAETAPRKRAASTPKPAAANPAEVVTEERGTAKVAELTPHSYSTEVFESGDISDLVTDIALHGITKDLMVCGDGCASPRGTVLAGCRRLAAAKAVGLSEVPVLWVHGLDEWQEKHRILRDNKADQFGREWSKVLLATVEHELKVLYERRPGYRSDLDTRFGNKASPTARIVADEVGEKPSGFYARDKIFYSSPITTPVLKDAVGDGRISETWAATLLRDVEREFGIVQLVRDITSGKSDGEVRIHAARAKVSEAVAKRLAEPKKPRGRRRKAEASSESTERGAPAEPLKEMLDIEELARDIEAYWRAEEALEKRLSVAVAVARTHRDSGDPQTAAKEASKVARDAVAIARLDERMAEVEERWGGYEFVVPRHDEYRSLALKAMRLLPRLEFVDSTEQYLEAMAESERAAG